MFIMLRGRLAARAYLFLLARQDGKSVHASNDAADVADADTLVAATQASLDHAHSRYNGLMDDLIADARRQGFVQRPVWRRMPVYVKRRGA